MSLHRTLLVGAFLISALPAQVTTLRVDLNAPPGGNGASWATAFQDLQAALASATGVTQIWVAAGTYTPGPAGGARTLTFTVSGSTRILGGFNGTETMAVQRDPAANVTILSGDLNGDDLPGQLTTNKSDNVYHVVTHSGTEVDGFTITGGNADGPSGNDQRAAGLSGSSPVDNCIFLENVALDRGAALDSPGMVANCSFIGNDAGTNGGAVFSSSIGVTVSACTFIGNNAGSNGGAIHETSGSITLTDCTFDSNTAGGTGGGFYHSSSPATLVRCVFINNSSVGDGGGVYFTSGTPTCVSCTFLGNFSGVHGGGVYHTSDTATHVNSVFSGNSCGQQGGGLHETSGSLQLHCCTFADNGPANNGGGLYLTSTAGSITNNVVWGNFDNNNTGQDANLFTAGFSFGMNFNIVEGWNGSLGGMFNGGSNPLFVDALGPDLIAGTGDEDLGLFPGSPAIDSGNSTSVPNDSADLDGDLVTAEPTPFDNAGNTRFFDDPGTADTGIGAPPIVDRGAFEYAGGSPYPGTGDDFTILTGIGAGAPNGLGVKTALAGQLATLSLVSPGGGLSGEVIILAVDGLPTGFVPIQSAAFPGLWLSPNAFVLLGIPTIVTLPPGGLTLSAPAPPGLTGLSWFFQGVSPTLLVPAGYATTNLHEIQFL